MSEEVEQKTIGILLFCRSAKPHLTALRISHHRGAGELGPVVDAVEVFHREETPFRGIKLDSITVISV